MPTKAKGKKFKHEDYSTALIRHLLPEVIDLHPENKLQVTAAEVCNFLQGDGGLPAQLLFWRPLITGQMDADRADYLLRDSHHAGVAYGQFDINRLIATLRVVLDHETGSLMIGVEKGGVQAVEGLILARYMMFVQVYFHHTRRAYDHHVTRVLRYLLEKEYGGKYGERGMFPPPTGVGVADNLAEYLQWNDIRIWHAIDRDLAGPDGKRIKMRQHDRRVYETSPFPSLAEWDELMEKIVPKLGEIDGYIDKADNSWYKFEKSVDIRVATSDRGIDDKAVPLSARSSLVRALEKVTQRRVYVPWEGKETAKTILGIRYGGESMTMNFEMPWERYALIAEIIRRCDAQRITLGKTALQKMIFLLQRVFGVDCDYTYTLYTYGPYCAEVAGDLDIVEGFRGAEITHGSSFGGYEIRPGPAASDLIQRGYDFIQRVSAALDKLISDYGRATAKELELRSTIVFLSEPEGDRQKLVDRVYDVKPHFSKAQIDAARKELDDKGYLGLVHAAAC